MNRLDITKLRIRTRITEDVALPGFLGNTIRGALGRALVEIYCDVLLNPWFIWTKVSISSLELTPMICFL